MGIDPDVKVILDAMQAEIDALKAQLQLLSNSGVPDGYTVHWEDFNVRYTKEF